jgi:hypothetical protein
MSQREPLGVDSGAVSVGRVGLVSTTVVVSVANVRAAKEPQQNGSNWACGYPHWGK